MSTKISLASALAASGLDHLADDLWENLGDVFSAVVQLEVCEKTEPADDETDRKVKLKLVAIETPREVAPGTTNGSMAEQDPKDQLRAMYARRTGKDSLFDDTKVTLTHNGQSVDTTTGELKAVANR